MHAYAHLVKLGNIAIKKLDHFAQVIHVLTEGALKNLIVLFAIVTLVIQECSVSLK